MITGSAQNGDSASRGMGIIDIKAASKRAPIKNTVNLVEHNPQKGVDLLGSIPRA